MFDKIKVFDDVIPQHLQDYLELSIFGRPYEGGEIHPTVDFRIKYETTAIESDKTPVSFKHILKSSTQLSPHYENFSLLPIFACGRMNKVLQEILVARIFLVMPYETDRDHMEPHVDYHFPHDVVLYYVNDADGDTVFYNNQGQVIKRVTPKKGRLVMFDGLTLHSGGIPKNGPRCIVNFDLLTENK
jgi:hypothetical protein